MKPIHCCIKGQPAIAATLMLPGDRQWVGRLLVAKDSTTHRPVAIAALRLNKGTMVYSGSLFDTPIELDFEEHKDQIWVFVEEDLAPMLVSSSVVRYVLGGNITWAFSRMYERSFERYPKAMGCLGVKIEGERRWTL